MKLEFVRSDVLRNIHGRLIEKYGGIVGVRDENALESATSRPRNPAVYGGVTPVPHLGAELAWSLLRNHPFSDGNKRSAFAAMDVFFEINGYRLTCKRGGGNGDGVACRSQRNNRGRMDFLGGAKCDTAGVSFPDRTRTIVDAICKVDTGAYFGKTQV